MEREILFRGKRFDNGEWVHGLLCQYHEEISAKIVPNDFGDFYSKMVWVVDPATVGRYTGLTDKNGKKIFEGDIVDYKGTKHEVVFETRFTAYFGIKISHIETWSFCLEVPSKLMEVVGNIHDNPELMERKE